jgi:hypothetical protein
VSFWLHESRIKRSLKKLSSSTRIIILLTFISVGLCSWLYLFYWPLQAAIQREEHEIQQLQEHIKIFQKEFTSFHLNDRSGEVQKDYYKCVARYANVQDTIDFIFALLKAHKVTCKNLQPFHEKDEIQSDALCFRLCMKGSFKKILSFLVKLQESDHLVSFEDFILSRNAGKKITFDALIKVPHILLVKGKE